jgi:hypothetical protein
MAHDQRRNVKIGALIHSPIGESSAVTAWQKYRAGVISFSIPLDPRIRDVGEGDAHRRAVPAFLHAAGAGGGGVGIAGGPSRSLDRVELSVMIKPMADRMKAVRSECELIGKVPSAHEKAKVAGRRGEIRTHCFTAGS